MQENVRRVVNFTQLFRRQEARPRDVIIDLESARQFLTLTQHRSFACDGERCPRITLKKVGKGVEGCGQAFLLDEPARLQKTPLAILGKAAFAERKFSQGNTCAHDVDLRFVTAQL